MKVIVFVRNGNTMLGCLEDYSFEYGGRAHTVPAGFECDGMSVPRFFWRLLSPPVDGRTIRAAIIHDFFYRTGLLGRAEADRIFREMMIEDGYPRWKAQAAYWAVRLAGRPFYDPEGRAWA